MSTETLSEGYPSAAVVRRGRRLEYLTIGWNALEALISIGAGIIAGSIALVGFGIDSIIEVSSGAVLLWRLVSGEHREKLALKLVGISFLALAGYVTIDAATTLWSGEAPEKSYVGIVIAILSLIVMPLLAAAKRKVASSIKSQDARRFSSDRHLCISFGNSRCWTRTERCFRLVVG